MTSYEEQLSVVNQLMGYHLGIKIQVYKEFMLT